MADQDHGQQMTPVGISWTPSEQKKTKGKTTRAQWITQCIRLMLASYRRDNTPNPDGYIATIALVLERYPDELIRRATHPVDGIVSEDRWQSFPPTAGELRAWLESKRPNTAWADRARAQLTEREALQRLHDSISPEERAAHVVRVENELAEHGMFTAGWKRRQRETELARTREATGQTGFVHPKRLLTWREAEIYRAERAVSLKAEADARAAVGRAARAAHASGAEEATPGGVPSKERTHGLPTSRK